MASAVSGSEIHSDALHFFEELCESAPSKALTGEMERRYLQEVHRNTVAGRQPP